MTRFRSKIFLLLTLLIFAGASRAMAQKADANPDDLNNLTLEDLLKVTKVTIASKKELSTKETPAIVTVISRDEILNSGARNLDDVLSLVPGFQVGIDYYGTVGVSVRGLWGLDGKLLYMIDGQEMNDVVYASAYLIDQVPMDQIDHIEIIRGPGSAIYGGTAEYAVMNVITLKGSQIHGFNSHGVYGQMDGGPAHQSVDFAYGEKYSNGLEMSLGVYAGQSNRTNKPQTYPDGVTKPAATAYSYRPQFLNWGANYKDLSLRVIASHTGVRSQDNNYAPFDNPYEQTFDQYITSAKYDYKANSKVTLSPEFSWTHSAPYHYPNQLYTNNQTLGAYPFTLNADRYKLNLPLNYDYSDELNVLAGATYFIDYAQGGSHESLFLDPMNPTAGRVSVVYRDYAIYAQAILTTEIGNFTAGVRDENHSYSGNSVVPRVAWTKQFGHFNAKALYSWAFRNPVVGDISDGAAAGNDVKPEKTKVAEVELSYDFGKNRTVSMNVFDTRVTGPMVYNAAATYTNDHNTGSTGFEIDARTQEKWGYANFTASFYQTNFASADQTTAFYVQPDPNQLMGFAPVKLTLNAKYKITNHLNVNPWLVYLSHRYTLSSSTEVDGSAVPLTTSSVPETLLTNIILNYQNLFIQNLDLSFGVYNIFNQSYVLATAYDFGRNPLTANPREAMASLNYSWHF